jgi:thioredoxin reductase (NADPH)
VTYEQAGKEVVGTFDTVIFAIGRQSLTKDIGLDKVDIKAEENGKLKVNDME